MPKTMPPLPYPMPVQAPRPPKPVAAVAPVKAPPATPSPQPSPMVRPPVAATQRLVPGVQSGRGMVRTDTHNVDNQLPAHAKHKGRGM